MRRFGPAIVGVFGMTLGCSALDVNAPTTLRIPDIENPNGALLAVNAARTFLMQALQRAVPSTGSLADEFGAGGGATSVNLRKSGSIALYTAWQDVYRRATIALSIARSAGVGGRASLSESYSLRGYALLGLAEHICPGFPVIQLKIEGEAITPVFTSAPQTADSAFARALADFDSALVYAGDSVRVRNFTQVGRGRALLGLGRFADAGTAVTDVPTEYRDSLITNSSLYLAFRIDRYGVQNREGTNGLDFVAAADPRVQLVDRLGNGSLWQPYIYYHDNIRNPPIVIASGVEARLIEAESQLHAGTTWLATLNALRQTMSLSDTTDPGTVDGQVDLLFRERAFWLFGTAHRLGDLRRLMARYGRNSETQFPVGPGYGSLTSFPFDTLTEQRFYPKITRCLDQ